ncbi:hypothetical protein Smp_199710 [Schistosoma mansoni]|uniref:hypothetical protein n=1 Tax=Schistosoma mansoni TaxID=6183 RepID=UPI00022C852C|nr:hypothetical protein Smp_199710 [Schistosoma mansoni]|eukprot:XP_018644741.1 hypothetical protein Smp_199710 [Schistosoma mansoni]
MLGRLDLIRIVKFLTVHRASHDHLSPNERRLSKHCFYKATVIYLLFRNSQIYILMRKSLFTNFIERMRLPLLLLMNYSTFLDSRTGSKYHSETLL